MPCSLFGTQVIQSQVSRLLPGLENYLSDDRTGYAVLNVGPLSPHACTSFEHPARYAVTVKGVPERSLLLVALRGRDRAEDISWRVYVNEVKVSRVFRPQHLFAAQDGYYYTYVADVSPVVRSAGTVELAIRCHGRDTFVEAVGLVTLTRSGAPARAGVYAGVSRVWGDLSLRLADSGFSVLSMVGRGEGGEISVGGAARRVSGLFELTELLRDNLVSLRGPLNVYAVVANVFTGRQPELSIDGLSTNPGRVKFTLVNSGDYPVESVDLRLLRGTQAVSRLSLERVGPRESVDVVLEGPTSGASAVKVSYEFSGQVFVRVLRLAAP